jgi:hypothetical protein
VLIVSLGWWPEKIVANELTSASIVGIFLVVGSVLIVQLMPMIKQRKEKKLALAS